MKPVQLNIDVNGKTGTTSKEGLAKLKAKENLKSKEIRRKQEKLSSSKTRSPPENH